MKRRLIINSILIPAFAFLILLKSENNVKAEPAFSSAAPFVGDVLYLNWADHDGVLSGKIPIVKGTSQVLRFQRSISRAAISNEEICDIQPLGKHEILLHSKQPGSISLIVWDDQFNVASYAVESTLDLNKLKEILLQIDPKSDIDVMPFQETILVSGYVSTIGKIKQIEDAVNSFDEKAVTYIKVAEPKQILLEVRFAEVNRKANEDFGFDVETAFKDYYIRSLTGNTGARPSDGGDGGTIFGGSDETINYTPFKSEAVFAPLLVPATTDSTANLYGAFVGKRYMIQPFLQSLEQKNILKIIARPNLVTRDGEKASFSVGGEFPVPITTDNQINVTWKRFGTNLKFTPEVLEDDTILLQIETVVSELDFSTSVTIQGTTIPTLLSREHQTVAGLKEDQSLVIGGLLTQRVNRVNRRTPILANIPLIGKAFKKEAFSRTDVELLIVITPHIVSALDTNEQKVFYEKDKVLESIRPLYPSYSESQGDQIRSLLTQNEEHQYFDEDARKKAEKAAKQALEKEQDKQQAAEENLEAVSEPVEVEEFEQEGADIPDTDEQSEAVKDMVSAEAEEGTFLIQDVK